MNAAVDGAMPPAQYEVPSWSGAPRDDSYRLDIIKDGVVARSHCVIQHRESGEHCVIQHRESGEVYLYDLDSTHGTQLNKTRVPPRTFVPLPLPSSVLRLGQSSRLLCVEGPPPTEEIMDAAAARAARAGGGAAAAAPPDSDAARQERAAKVAARTGKSLVRAEDLHGDAGWGFGADAVDEGGDDGDDGDLANADFERLYQTAKAKGVNMTARQGRLAEQLEKRSAKLSNLVEESDRIKAKEWEGLSEGQQAHKAKNAERVEALRQEIAIAPGAAR